MRVLLNGGANVNKAMNNGATLVPLATAASGCCPWQDPSRQRPPAADPSRQRPSAADPSRQRPPAYIGAQEDHESAVQVLFDGGADVNKAANGGGTPA